MALFSFYCPFLFLNGFFISSCPSLPPVSHGLLLMAVTDLLYEVSPDFRRYYSMVIESMDPSALLPGTEFYLVLLFWSLSQFPYL